LQPAFVNNWRERFPRSNPPDPGNIWLVFRLDSGSALPKLYNDRSKPASFWDKLSAPAMGGSAAGAAEARFIRQVMKNSIAALAFLHDRQVLHRSVSAPSIVLSSINAEDSSSLRVKMQDFGFASRASQLDEASLFKARQVPIEKNPHLRAKRIDIAAHPHCAVGAGSSAWYAGGSTP
jgi:serine/threonine protein kinase